MRERVGSRWSREAETEGLTGRAIAVALLFEHRHHGTRFRERDAPVTACASG